MNTIASSNARVHPTDPRHPSKQEHVVRVSRKAAELVEDLRQAAFTYGATVVVAEIPDNYAIMQQRVLDLVTYVAETERAAPPSHARRETVVCKF